MKHFRNVSLHTFAISTSLILSVLFLVAAFPWDSRPKMPYADAGFSKKQAAAYLLNRFAYGPTPGEVDKVAQIGPEKWFEQQLKEANASPEMNALLKHLDALNLNNEQIMQEYPPRFRILKEAVSEGVIPKNYKDLDKKQLQAALIPFMRRKGYRPIRNLIFQLDARKIIRDVYDNNQLEEVLTDFWFNHFNVSVNNPRVRQFVLSYERDAIRPNVLKHFSDLLIATAEHPAMLYYLNNAESTAADSAVTTTDSDIMARADQMGYRRRRFVMDRLNRMKQSRMSRQNKSKFKGGINENYAREVMELHTLGVSGGYTQTDVEQLARIFTGWSVVPMQKKQAARFEENETKLERVGFVRRGDFLFRANVHDAGQKIFLRKLFPAGHGLDEGIRALKMLALSPATARHISYELAVRFVSDHPSPALVNKLSETYLKTNGDIKNILITMVGSPEFWSQKAYRSKIKSPVELIASSLRALNARIYNPRQLIKWYNKMGEPLYSYLAPTGYPDSSGTWVNAGSLLNRMNFGLLLASGKIKGIGINLLALNRNREPASAEDALKVYAPMLLPERDLKSTYKALTPIIENPVLAEKVSHAANQYSENNKQDDSEGSVVDMSDENEFPGISRTNKAPSMLAQVVGVIMGSPEFQRK